MPEPLKRLESEDVLTSIRRLVSEASGGASPAERPGPLLLLPAFRVAGGRMDAHAAPAGPGAGDTAPGRLVAAGDPAGGSPATRGSDRTEAAPGDAAPAPDHAPDDETDYGICDDRHPAADGSEPTLGELVTDLGAAIGNPPGEFEPDGSEDQTFAASGALARLGQTEADPVPGQPLANDADHPAHELAAHDGGQMLDEALIDEDSLREIVTDLVRQELRGELGERMTRNIRRLIRQEINRALTLRDIEGND